MRTIVIHMSRLGILFCVVSNSSVINHRRRCHSFVFFCFALSSWIDVPVWQNLSAEGSASSCSKRFLTGMGFEPTHALVYQNSRLRIFLSLALYTARPFCLVFVDTFFHFDLWPFYWVIFSIPRCNLLNVLCHPFEKICVQTHAFVRVSHVSAGYLLFFCALINRSAVGQRWRCDFFVFCSGLSSSINDPVWQNLSAEGSASSCSKRFLTGVGFGPTHTLVYQNSRLRIFLSLAP